MLGLLIAAAVAHQSPAVMTVEYAEALAKTHLRDPSRARFRNLHPGRRPFEKSVICGELQAGDERGARSPWTLFMAQDDDAILPFRYNRAYFRAMYPLACGPL